MKRRDVVIAPLALSAATLAWTQSPGRTYRVGYLASTDSHAPAELSDWNDFVQRLWELGYRRGGNLVIEERYARGPHEHYSEMAAEMVKIKADVVVVNSGTMARYVMGLSRTLPIVAISLPYPVRSGLVASLARPGGQVTGVSDLSDELVPKRLELLKAAVPSIKRIAYAHCPYCGAGAGMSGTEVRALQVELDAAAHALGVTLVPASLNDPNLFDGTANIVRRERVDALLIGNSRPNLMASGEWRVFAATQRLATMAPYRSFGAMLSYGSDFSSMYRRAAEQVAKILGGTSPGEIPMEQPMTFEFTVNLKIARSLGLTIPPAVMLRATEVIE